ncbi:toxin-antitoxin system HicB family antitoxin [Blastococcus sp. CT_GayMR16]|uniref:toxin-antitoxin system HicB family antitoxin n=1 Tax=Blastococcus sp. CT_GayMR16 TaxID=2559607 RepID=UPI001073FA3D|nr:toxin-antitoxin system HicB family antitoxin [Blastococcus sp. CT_GayMR16]TFV89936.1 toxin-antitoxin system HicB family antitoxin [Blastococcus sp. CT_GayMR16]
MDLSPYVDQLRRELVATADVGGDEARALAERLTAPLEASLRLALLSALSTAAEEITSQLAPGAVDVRLRGGDIGFVVTGPRHDLIDDDRGPADAPAPATGSEPPPAPPSSAPGPDPDEGATARITLRIPEQLKSRVEDAAAREGFSVNTWLTRAVTRGLEPGDAGGSTDRRRGKWSGQHYSGWVR